MRSLKSLVANHPAPRKPKRQTERGDLLDTMLARLNPSRIKAGYKPLTHGRLAFLLTKVPTPDLYALVSRCNHAEKRGYPWSAIFWKEIRPAKTDI